MTADDILAILDDPQASDLLQELLLLADVVEKGQAMPLGTISERQKGKEKIFFRKFGANDWRQVKRSKKGWTLVQGGAKAKSPGDVVRPDKAGKKVELYRDRIHSLADIASNKFAESDNPKDISATMKNLAQAFTQNREALKNMGPAGEKAWKNIQGSAKKRMEHILEAHSLIGRGEDKKVDPNIKASYDKIMKVLGDKAKKDPKAKADPKADEKAKEVIDKLSKVKDAKDPEEVMAAMRSASGFASLGGVLSGMASLAKALAILALPLLLVTALGMLL